MLACGVLVGCGSEAEREDSGPERVTVEDSAGVEIVVTPGDSAQTPLGWTVDSVPELELGRSDDPSGGFFQIRGVAPLSDGNFAVVDGGGSEVVFFQPDGEVLARSGGRGDGPGEFHDPWLVPRAEKDSIAVYDMANPKFEWFSEDGEHAGHRNGGMARLGTRASGTSGHGGWHDPVPTR